MTLSKGRRCRRGPDWRQSSSLWRGVKLSCIMHLCGHAAVIHGRATRGHCHRVGQARVLAAAASKKLGAHVCPILGHRSQRGVAHRPQAGVLTAWRHGEKVLLWLVTLSPSWSPARDSRLKIPTVMRAIISTTVTVNENLLSRLTISAAIFRINCLKKDRNIQSAAEILNVSNSPRVHYSH